MIPQKLTLQNFLSYRNINLDFSGLHTACICGANGAGKSSLLEAMTWAIWGKTRTNSDEDVIHLGEKSTRVDFEFIYNQQLYRIVRTRPRKGSATLDFQINNGKKFTPISEKTVKETQNKIVEYLKIDYDTFINSAYLKQGRADEFMLRRPAERKKILADLLKLEQYEKLATQAKDSAKDYKPKIDILKRNIEEINEKLDEQSAIKLELENTEKDLEYLNSQQQQTQADLQQVKTRNSQRETLLQQQKWQQNQLQNLAKRIEELAEEKQKLEQELNQYNLILAEAEEIETKYQQLQTYQTEENQLRQKFQLYQQASDKQRKLEQKLAESSNNLKIAIAKQKTTLENLQKEEADLQKTVNKKGEIQENLTKYNNYKEQLNYLDEIQHQVAPLQQQQITLETELAQIKARLEAKLEQLHREEQNLHDIIQQVPNTRNRFFGVEKQLKKLEDTKNYQQRVKQKGEKQNSLHQEYLVKQDNLKNQLEKLKQKLATLGEESAICPLCEQALDETHLHHVITKTKQEQSEIEAQSWRYETEMRNCQRELEKLRVEYSQLNQELAQENELNQERAKLENKLDSYENTSFELSRVQTEKEEIINLLENDNYAPEIRQELEVIFQQIKDLNYNQETHAIVRKQESELRWVELKNVKIKDAENRLQKLTQRKPQLEQEIKEKETQLQELTKTSPLQVEINQLKTEIAEINYDSNCHNQLRENLQQLQSYQSRYSELKQAQKQQPLLIEKITNLTTNLTKAEEEKNANQQEINNLQQQLSQLTDYSEEVAKLEQEVNKNRDKIHSLFTKKGGLEQSLTNLKNQEKELKDIKKDLQEAEKKYRIYQELGVAFGKNGIQALMIENILPELEAEANHILARLSGNQFHVQFLTQKPKANRGKKSKSTSSHKDTLEIAISDAQGTRPYETYSGGEAFRINFSVRLALSRILAGRSGTALQFLMIDEGFGTQDMEGCDRLIAALNEIADEFACILIVTHMPQFKEAFQSRIEVYKTEEGSKIRLSR